MKKNLQGFVELTRINHSLVFVVISTLLGVTAAGGSFHLRFFILLPANLLSVSVGYMVKNIMTAPEDALFTNKSPNNPISTGMLTPKQARIRTLIVVVISLILYIFLGTWPLIFGLMVMVVGFLSASEGVVLNSMVDLLFHSLCLAGLPFLIGFFVFTDGFNQTWFWLFAFLLAVSLFKKLDLLATGKQDNRTARKSRTRKPKNKRSTHIFMFAVLVIAIFLGFISLFIKALIPMWVAILILILAIIFSIPRVIKARNARGNLAIRGTFEKSLESAAALGLFLQFLIPWLSQYLSIPLIWWVK